MYCDTCPNTTKNLFYTTIRLWLSSGKDLTCALDIISDKTLQWCACNLVIKLVVKTWNSEKLEFCNINTILISNWSVHNHKILSFALNMIYNFDYFPFRSNILPIWQIFSRYCSDMWKNTVRLQPSMALDILSHHSWQ